MQRQTFGPPSSPPFEVERRKKRRPSGRTCPVIGALIVLDDGTRCIFAGHDQQGNILCYPTD